MWTKWLPSCGIFNDGSLLNILLIDKKEILNNRLQVINQYEEDGGNHDNRYDVTLLVNGLPLVHIELKRRGVAIKEAFNQINRYQRDSFWASSGLYEFVQIFVISNGTHTKYYSNTTRQSHIDEITKQSGAVKKTSHSFEFTSYWADGKNKNILDLEDFTKTFLNKRTILNVLVRYCVFTADELLLVMRPYQIYATEKILNKILIATNYKKYGKIDAGGYIWHTTGSGKTLTSFKTAQLATELTEIDKVLFVVDRKDLDYQTMKEYDKFEKGAANGNRSTKILTKQLEDDNCRIIVTTIQKLNTFISKNKYHDIYNKKVVMIFDECHRSQFGEMHFRITKAFKKYYIFGFTGTPIFAQNSSSANSPKFSTTEQLFGDRLHTYTVVNAIHDGNVLPFRIDYVNTIKQKEIKDKEVEAINIKTAILAPERISNITSYIIEHFDQKTMRSAAYKVKGNYKFGFNSIFAVDSIEMAKMYYLEFKKQLKETGKDLKVATIYSFNPNEEDPDGFFGDEEMDLGLLDVSSRDFLDSAINDYNLMFHTHFDSEGEGFQNYYKDIAQRMKNKEIDILIVVNMFLTGFDATTLNTLWVDKNLKMHGLIQAFSRTNRILNSIKTFGNIVCFRNLEKATEEAISLFGDEDANGIVLLKDFNSYYKGYTDELGTYHKGYIELVDELLDKYPLGVDISGEKNEKNFIKLFGKILRLRNILNCFDEFAEDNSIKVSDMQDYQSIYIDLYDKYRRKLDQDSIKNDVEFEMELVKQVQIDIDYILDLVKKNWDKNHCDKELLGVIGKAIDSTINLRSKKTLILGFINTISNIQDVTIEWKNYVSDEADKELERIITEEKLNDEATKSYVAKALKDGVLNTNGLAVDMILPKVSRFGGKRLNIKERVIERLVEFFDRFSDVL